MATKRSDPTLPPATNDAYTGMLAISLLALIVGSVLLYLDYSQYPDSKAPTIPKAPAIASPDKAPEPQPQVAVPNVAVPVAKIEEKKGEEKKGEEKK
jgi:hypothetical protein